jgi:Haem-binding domain/Cytochrome P460
MKRFSHKQWLWFFIICLFVFLGIQFVRPSVKNPLVTGNLDAPDSIQMIMIKSCYDCHSNTTKLSWFDKIAPASWIVADHIHEGRKLMNFSEWDSLTGVQKKSFLFESLSQIEFDEMPLHQYTLLHPSAKVTPFEINTLKSYLQTLFYLPVPDSSKARIRKEQFDQWMQRGIDKQVVKPSLNGIVYMQEYKDWTAISSTERLDNGTMRVIVGNDITINAIKTNQTNPWPDGSVIVKIIWTMVADTSGDIQTGELKQLDFMIRGKDKYAPTKGWGFARWVRGLELVPYGKNVLFASECIHCHQTMKEHDFIFTMPIHLEAEHGPEDRVISSSIQSKEGTMSTLYGNRIAVNFIRMNNSQDYPVGSVLTMVTWSQKADSHWFGARIPGNIKFIEKVRFENAGNGKSLPQYEKYSGNSTAKLESINQCDFKSRLNYILMSRASVMP